MVGDHLLPLHGIAVLIREPLPIHAVGEDHRTAQFFAHGAIDVGAQHETVLHLDRLVPCDPHAVADFGAHIRVGCRVH